MFFFLFFYIAIICNAQTNGNVLITTEPMPTYPGGESALYSFISDEKIRPLTDKVEVVLATKVAIDLTATVTVFDSNSLTNIKQQILSNFSNKFLIGEKVIFSKVIDLLHINGVYRVDTNIKNDVEIASNEVAIINLSLTMEIKQ